MANPKVVWSEGLFLTPQHLQKAEFYQENFAKDLVKETQLDNLFGFSELELNRSLLDLGKLGIKSAKGIFQDGTPFCLTQELVIDIPEGTSHDIVYLALPLHRDGNITIDYGAMVKTRYRSYDMDVYDNTAINSEPVKVEVADLNLSLKLSSEKLDSYLVLPVAQISECVAGTGAVLNQAFIPQCTNIIISNYVRDNINYIYDKLQFRVETLSKRIANCANNKSYQSMIRDFMWMSALCQWTPLWREFAESARTDVHASLNPHYLYLLCISMVGQMYGLEGRVPPKLPLWSFSNLYDIFSQVFSHLHECLRDVQTDNVTTLVWDTSLFQSRHLLRTMVRDRALYSDSRFILVVTASCGIATLIAEFPKACKLAGNTEIANIVINALSGVPMRNLPVAPSELKSKTNAAYFEIDTRSPLWQNIINNDEPIVLHIDEKLKDITVELNIIK